MRKLRIAYGQYFYSFPMERCFYCERHLSGCNNWTNLPRCYDLLRPSTRLSGNKMHLIVCHTCQRARSRLTLAISWLSPFYRIDTINFHTSIAEQEFDQFYMLSDRARTGLQFEAMSSRQQKKWL